MLLGGAVKNGSKEQWEIISKDYVTLSYCARNSLIGSVLNVNWKLLEKQGRWETL